MENNTNEQPEYNNAKRLVVTMSPSDWRRFEKIKSEKYKGRGTNSDVVKWMMEDEEGVMEKKSKEFQESLV